LSNVRRETRRSQVYIGFAQAADDAAAILVGRSAELMLRVGRLMSQSRELSERAERLREIAAAQARSATRR